MAQTDDPLVSTAWLAERMDSPGLRIVDATWPSLSGTTPAEDFAAGHIPGAVPFDLDAVADPTSALPHMLPSAEQFARAVGELGIADGDTVVVYDARGLFSAPRVWWSFRVFGHDKVYVLDGGLPKWQREGRPLATGPAQPDPRTYTPQYRPDLVRDLEAIRADLAAGSEAILDARPSDRFQGTSPEGRPGLRAGHIPGSRNLPFIDLIDRETGTMRAPGELGELFARTGLDSGQPAAATCGSGVTACIIALARKRVDGSDMAVYDGSWADWGRESAGTPVAQGPAEDETLV